MQWEVGRRILHKKLISGVVAHALASSVESLTVGRPLTQTKNKMAEVRGGNAAERLQNYVNNQALNRCWSMEIKWAAIRFWRKCSSFAKHVYTQHQKLEEGKLIRLLQQKQTFFKHHINKCTYGNNCCFHVHSLPFIDFCSWGCHFVAQTVSSRVWSAGSSLWFLWALM